MTRTASLRARCADALLLVGSLCASVAVAQVAAPPEPAGYRTEEYHAPVPRAGEVEIYPACCNAAWMARDSANRRCSIRLGASQA